MNAASTARYLAWFEEHKDVMKAFACGEEVQCQINRQWRDITSPVWDWDGNIKYRIKPKPKSIFVVYRKTGDGFAAAPTMKEAEHLKTRLDSFNKEYAPHYIAEFREVAE